MPLSTEKLSLSGNSMQDSLLGTVQELLREVEEKEMTAFEQMFKLGVEFNPVTNNFHVYLAWWAYGKTHLDYLLEYTANYILDFKNSLNIRDTVKRFIRDKALTKIEEININYFDHC